MPSCPESSGVPCAADFIVQYLRSWGIKALPGLPTKALLPLIQAAERHGLRFIEVRHENTAAFMASAHAKLTGQLGVCLTSSGYGLTNMLTGLYDAALDGVPLLLLQSQETPDPPFLPFAAFRQRVMPITDLPEALPKAIQAAYVHGGVSHLAFDASDLPTVLPDALQRARPPFIPAAQTLPSPELLDQVTQVIQAAHRPLLLAGRGAKGARQALIDFAERSGIPVMTSLTAKGLFPEHHPLFLGTYGPEFESLLGDCDLLISLGFQHPLPAVPPRLIQIEARPEHLGQYHYPELGLVGDARLTLAELAQQLSPKQEPLVRPKREAPLSILSQALQAGLPDDAILALECEDGICRIGHHFQADHHSFLLSEHLHGPGFAFAAALAAKLEHPDRQILCLTSAEGMSKAMADFITAVRYSLAFPTLVIVRDGPHPNFAAFAQSCGGMGLQIKDPERLGGALKEFLRLHQPTLIEVRL